MEHVLEFKYLGFVGGKSDTHEAECCKEMANKRKEADTIKYVVDAKCLLLECAKVLHENVIVPVLM